jgi:hypothetical protein
MTIEFNRAPEAANNVKYWPVTLTQGTWTYPVTSKLLLQAGATYGHNLLNSNHVDGVTTADIPITELSSGFFTTPSRVLAWPRTDTSLAIKPR